jgi:putative membrane protein
MSLSEKEQQEINSLVARFEAGTGIQAVAAVVGKVDAYPELPWKAYAIGSALGALTIVLPLDALAHWSTPTLIALHAMIILGAGAALAAAAAFVPSVGRLFLDRLRAEAEGRQYAQMLFLEREFFRTSDRCAVLVLVARFERTAVILADKGLAAFAPAAALERIAASMRSAIAAGRPAAAFEIAFDELTELLELRPVGKGASANTLDDGVVVEKGT